MQLAGEQLGKLKMELETDKELSGSVDGQWA